MGGGRCTCTLALNTYMYVYVYIYVYIKSCIYTCIIAVNEKRGSGFERKPEDIWGYITRFGVKKDRGNDVTIL